VTQVIVVVVVAVVLPTVETALTVDDVLVTVLVAVCVVVGPVEMAVLFDVEVAVTVESDSVTVLSGLVVTLVTVVVVVPPLTVWVFVLVFVTVFVLVTLHLRVKWLRVPLTLWRRHFAGTELGPPPAERATPTGTSSTTATTRSPSERIMEARFTAASRLSSM
jgi:hypothetical protein